MTMHDSPIFIVGASRSGTAMMRSVLNNHPDVLISGESHYFDDLRMRMADQVTSILTDAQREECEDYFLALDHRPYGHHGEPEKSDMKRQDLRDIAAERGQGADAYFEAFCIVRARRDGKRIWGDKTPRHVFRIPELIAAYPDAKILCMVRDARAVVASYRDWRNQGGFDLSVDPGHADALVDEEKRVRRSYNPILIGLLWRSAARAARSGVEKFGKDRIRIQRYERLVASPESELRQITDWLGVEFDPEMLEIPMLNSSFSKFSEGQGISDEAVERWKGKLSPLEVAVIQSCCHADMTQFGYESVQTGTPSWSVFGAWVSLPFATIRAAMANRDRMGNIPAYIIRRIRLAFAR